MPGNVSAPQGGNNQQMAQLMQQIQGGTAPATPTGGTGLPAAGVSDPMAAQIPPAGTGGTQLGGLPTDQFTPATGGQAPPPAAPTAS